MDIEASAPPVLLQLCFALLCFTKLAWICLKWGLDAAAGLYMAENYQTKT